MHKFSEFGDKYIFMSITNMKAIDISITSQSFFLPPLLWCMCVCYLRTINRRSTS